MKRIGKIFLLFFVSGLVSSYAFNETVSPAPLSVDIALVPSGTGASIAYLVFSSPDGFPDGREKALRQGFVPVATFRASHQQIDLGPLPVGRYAVALYLDLNGNHKLDHGLLGIPKEPVGVSNNPKRFMGPPRFDECSFVHGSIPQVISITLVR